MQKTSKENEKNYKQIAEEYVRKISAEVLDRFNVRIAWSGGSLYENLSDVYLSFCEAKKAILYRVFKEDIPIIWDDNYSTERFLIYYYPIELEARLINYVRNGDFEQIMNILKKVYIVNFIRRDLDYINSQQLINEMYGTIVKSVEQIRINQPEILELMEEKLKKIYSYQAQFTHYFGLD